MKQLNLLLSFLLELVLITLFGYWGYQQGETETTKYIFALVLPAILILIWGLWAAPKSKRRLKNPIRSIFKLSLFAIGVFFCIDSGHATLAIWFAAITVANVILAFLFAQDF